MTSQARELSVEEQANAATISAFLAVYNNQSVETAESYFSDELTYVAFGPWPISGRTFTRRELIALMKSAAQLYRSRSFNVQTRVVEGDTVVIEGEWLGIAGETHPTLKPGERECLREVVFYRLRRGKIVEQREYGVPISE